MTGVQTCALPICIVDGHHAAADVVVGGVEGDGEGELELLLGQLVDLRHEAAGSMLPMFAICSNSRIFSRRAFSSGVRFFLAI